MTDKKVTRIMIAGSPRAGKSTLFQGIFEDTDVLRTDSFLPMDWSEHSALICSKIDSDPDWVVLEGTAVPRALRKWLALHKDDQAKPCDILIWLQPVMELTTGQASMAKGELTVLKPLLPELVKRGVRILWDAPTEFFIAHA